MSDRQFSVLIATYEGDDPDDLSRALQSVIDQTVRPDEIVVVADGPLTAELEAALDDFESAHPDLLTRTALSTNQGLGAALNHGVETCSHEWIARMDSDDIAVEDRFEQQFEYLDENPETDVLGGYIGEFSDDPDDIETVREVPTTPDRIRSMARFRCPLNHPTVMFRRSAVLEVGNYRPLRSMQDYDLWMRMLAKDYRLLNTPTILVKCDAGKELFARRGGLSYARIEMKLQYEFFRLGMNSVPVFLLNICVRIPLRLIPNRLRGFVYRVFLRD
ncbi:glycosyltransferase [Halorubrum aethiopicum]|uniref:glycosyltransferase n=1 Tax=Halorubrum aethiopicum TaxID=1758255 RepID=UPI00082ACE6C|nr:glycosyltransferase [Halorubrum aethiopicum]